MAIKEKTAQPKMGTVGVLPFLMNLDEREVLYVVLDYICDKDNVALARRDGAMILIDVSCGTCLKNISPQRCPIKVKKPDKTSCEFWV